MEDHNNKIPQKNYHSGAADWIGFNDDDDQEEQLKRKVDDVRPYDNTFDPFKGQRASVFADRIKNAQNPPHIPINIVIGFQSSDRLVLESNLNESPSTAAVHNNEAPEISDSEILDACVNAEQKFFQKTEMPNKSIVESILEDFCSSPSPPESVCSANTTPTFNYRKTIRTYGRNVRLGEQLELVSPTSSRLCQSRRLSSLSLQDELETVENRVVTVDLNQSQYLCNNLLNLSAYFSDQPIAADANSQLSPMQQQFKNIPEDQQNEDVQESEDMWKILELKKNFPVSKRRRSLSSEFFYGFSDDSEPEDSSDRCDGSLTNNMNIRPKINTNVCDNPSYGKATAPENPVNYCQIDDTDFRENRKEKMQEQELSIENDEMWNEDNEFFMHFKTQDAVMAQVSPVYNNKTNHTADLLDSKIQNVESTALCCGTSLKLIGFQTATGKKITISKEASECAAKMLQTFEDVEEKIIIESLQPNTQRMEANLTKFQMQIQISDDIKAKASLRLLEHFKQNANPLSVNLEMNVKEGSRLQSDVKPAFQTTTAKCEISKENLKANTKGSENYAPLKGFQTASGEKIRISKDAIDRATNIFQNIADSEDDLNLLTRNKSKQFRNESNSNLKSDVEMCAFKEGSRLQSDVKPAFQTTTAKYEISKENLKANTKGSENYALLKGFQTASGEKIRISKDAIDRATNIFQNIADSEDDLNLLTLNKSKQFRNESNSNLKTDIEMCAFSSSPKIKKLKDSVLETSTPTHTVYPSAPTLSKNKGCRVSGLRRNRISK